MRRRRSPFVLAGLVVALVACGGDDDGSNDGIGGGDGGGDGDGPGVVACDLPPMGAAASTLAGCGEAGSADGKRGVALFNNPVNVIGGPGGEVFVADFDNDRIRVIAPDGTTRTLVEREGFARPFGLAFVGNTLFVSTDDNDAGQHSPNTGTVWRVNTSSGDAQVVARDIGRPRGLAALPDGRLVMADYNHHTVRILDPGSGQVTPLAGAADTAGFVDGPGATARFNGPYGVALASDGSILVTDYFNNRIRSVTLGGQVTTFAGNGTAGAGDGALAAASFAKPQGITTAGGDVFVTDTDNFAIRKLSGGQVTTLAGTGQGGFLDGNMADAQFYGLEGLDVSDDGATLWVADGNRGEDVPFNRVRVLTLR